MHATRPDVERVVVRYEDLVNDLGAVTDRLARWLDVDLDPSQVIDRVGGDEAHMTSPSAERSVGRWRTDLEPGEADRIAVALGPLLAPFGYSL